MRQRVVITGMGVVTPLGNDVNTLWEGLLAGQSGVSNNTWFDSAGMEVAIAAEVMDFNHVILFDRQQARQNARFTLFALEATHQAVADAGLEFTRENKGKIGVLIGSGIGGTPTLMDEYASFKMTDAKNGGLPPITSVAPNAASAAVAYASSVPNLSF